MMADKTVMAKVDHFGFHNYGGDTGGAHAAIKSSAYPSRNFWMTEVTNVWDALPELGQNAAAYLIWDAYDSVYNHAILAGRGSTPPNDVGNGPPLLAYGSTSRSYTPRKAFYEHAQIFRFIDPGSRRIAATGASSTLTVYAFRSPATGRLTIVGRNTAGNSQTLAGTLVNLPAFATLECYQTTVSANVERRPDVPVTNRSFTATIAANSTFTLTTGASDQLAPAPPTGPQTR
jgi:O-glycosyl hydrolase